MFSASPEHDRQNLSNTKDVILTEDWKSKYLRVDLQSTFHGKITSAGVPKSIQHVGFSLTQP